MLSLDAQTNGAAPVAAQVQLDVTSGRFTVTTTADSGPGSFRQAILDSDFATGGANTILFAIPAPGVQTIAPLSALPAITDPVLIDGTSPAWLRRRHAADRPGRPGPGRFRAVVDRLVGHRPRRDLRDGFALGRRRAFGRAERRVAPLARRRGAGRIL